MLRSSATVGISSNSISCEFTIVLTASGRGFGVTNLRQFKRSSRLT